MEKPLDMKQQKYNFRRKKMIIERSRMISKLQKSGTEQMNFEVGIYRVREELK
jgi:hypothetical protein